MILNRWGRWPGRSKRSRRHPDRSPEMWRAPRSLPVLGCAARSRSLAARRRRDRPRRRRGRAGHRGFGPVAPGGRRGHSAEATWIALERLGDVIEADTLAAGCLETVAGFGGVEVVPMAGRTSGHSSQGRMMPWGRRWLPNATGSASTPPRSNSAAIWASLARTSVVGRTSQWRVADTPEMYRKVVRLSVRLVVRTISEGRSRRCRAARPCSQVAPRRWRPDRTTARGDGRRRQRVSRKSTTPGVV